MWIRLLAPCLVAFAILPALAQEQPLDPEQLRADAPPSLKTVPTPEPPNLSDFVVDRDAAIALGKALFWDMQVGSDGIQACATCHFHAGADNRFKNQISPGLLGGDQTFQVGGPNTTSQPADFPYHQRANPDRQSSPVTNDKNDVHSSQGVRLYQFVDIIPGESRELGTEQNDPVFNVGGTFTRRVEPRNTPSAINAVFTYANFWDGRANQIFNGVNPFGPSDLDSKVWVDNAGTLEQEFVRLTLSSLASQAVGPPGSDFEMSSAGRTFPFIGKKLLQLTPLGKQLVHAQDSVLGPLSNAPSLGLNTTYAALIQQAFASRFWSSSQIITLSPSASDFHRPTQDDPRVYPLGNGAATVGARPNGPLATNQFSQMQANFALFFGLAVQMYEATLRADDTPFDRFAEGDLNALTSQQLSGLNIFLSGGTECSACHVGPEFTAHSVGNILGRLPGDPVEIIERMNMALGEAFYDNGIYNISVRRTAEDLGRGGNDPFGFPLAFSRLALLKRAGTLPAFLAQFVPDLPCGNPCDLDRVAVDGAFKTSSLRNIELTGPYFHNGSAATLKQVVQFYARGGNFPEDNIQNLDLEIHEIGQLKENPTKQDALVAFLAALTDPRVRDEMAPFDHPALSVPNGSPGSGTALNCPPGPTPGIHESFCDDLIEIPAVGAGGRPAESLPPLQPFMGLDPFDPFPGREPLNSEDWNADGSDEIGVFRNGMWFLSHSPDFVGVDQTIPFGSPAPGQDSPDLGEFGCSDAGGVPDGVADLVASRKASSSWFVSQSSSGFPASPNLVVTFGTTAHKRILTRRLDTNGDGCSDIGVFRNGCFSILESPAYSVGGLRLVCFGLGTDEPVSGDLNGDGRSDLILWRAGTSHYTYRLSPFYTTDFAADLGGGAGNAPLVGDLNGDGLADLGSYNPANSTFRFTLSPDFVGTDLTVTHGVSGDVPVLADVNGDGASDLGVFRPAVARWSFLCSPGWAASCVSQSFGVAGDVPIYGKPAGIP